jgi:glycosyltransferase involved in cell wall biosynthesis
LTTAPEPSAAPPVSVVIPAYNRAGSIVAAIESVLRQTWTDFELIVVDDGSSDGTLEAAAEVRDPRVRLVANPRNTGAAGARNTGVGEARGTWIAFQDSDDEWLPQKLEKQMARIAADPAFVGAYCGLLTVGRLDPRPGERTHLRYVPHVSVTPAEGDILAPLLQRNLISTQTLVVRRDLFLELGGFDDETTPIEDWDFVLRLAHRGPIAFIDEPLVHQHFSANSITRWAKRRRESQERMVTKNMAFFARRPDLLAHQYYVMAGDNRKAGDLAEARRLLGLARAAAPGAPKIRGKLWAMSAYVALLGLAAPLRRRSA